MPTTALSVSRVGRATNSTVAQEIPVTESSLLGPSTRNVYRTEQMAPGETACFGRAYAASTTCEQRVSPLRLQDSNLDLPAPKAVVLPLHQGGLRSAARHPVCQSQPVPKGLPWCRSRQARRPGHARRHRRRPSARRVHHRQDGVHHEEDGNGTRARVRPLHGERIASTPGSRA